jgi:hypothetical protein
MTFKQFVTIVRRTGYLGGHDVSPQRVNDWFADDHKREVILAARGALLAAPPKPEKSPREGPSMELRWTDDFKADDWWSKLRPQLTDYLRAQLQRRSKSLAEPLDAEGEGLREAGRMVRVGSGKLSSNPKKRVEASDFFKGYDLLRKRKGRLVGLEVIFGAATECQMIFKPYPNGTMRVGCASAIGADGLKATLSKGRRLWDAAANAPCVEYCAIEDATTLNDQMAEVVKGTMEMPSAKEIHFVLTNLLESLRKNPKRLALAFEQFKKFSGEANEGIYFTSPSESYDVRNVKEKALSLALKKQRPPTMHELRSKVGWSKRPFGRDQKAFRTTLRLAGLGWLPRENQLKSVLRKVGAR